MPASGRGGWRMTAAPIPTPRRCWACAMAAGTITASTSSSKKTSKSSPLNWAEIRIGHYPPYCSKYNPIEHRLFPHVTRAGQGVIFTSVALVKEPPAAPQISAILFIRLFPLLGCLHQSSVVAT